MILSSLSFLMMIKMMLLMIRVMLISDDDDEGEYDGVDSDNFVARFIATL